MGRRVKRSECGDFVETILMAGKITNSLLAVQDETKVCLESKCRQAWELRHFTPMKGEVDGLSPVCDGCRYRMDTYRRLVTQPGVSKKK